MDKESHRLLGLKLNVSQSSFRSSGTNFEDKRKSSIMLGTDRRFKTYTDALSESQDGFRIPGIKTPMREESAMRMRNDSRMSLNSNESASNLRQSSIRLGYRDSLIGN